MSSDPFHDRRQRIIKHINADHQPELSRYLQHFANLPASIAEPSESSSQQQGPFLRDVTYERMLITALDGNDYSVPFTPPLSAWDEIRPRVVEMDKKARSALNPSSSGVVVDKYLPPSGFGAVVFSLVVFYFGCKATLPSVQPGTQAWDVLSKYWPGGPANYRWVVETIFWPVIGLHTLEAAIFDQTRLAKNGVQRGSKLWWLWIANCWVEGFTTFIRVDGLIAKKKAQGKGK